MYKPFHNNYNPGGSKYEIEMCLETCFLQFRDQNIPVRETPQQLQKLATAGEFGNEKYQGDTVVSV